MEIVCVWHKRSTAWGEGGNGCGRVVIGERGETEAETVVMAIVRTERAAKEAEMEVVEEEEEEGGQPQLCASTHWQTEHYELKLFSLQQQQEQ